VVRNNVAIAPFPISSAGTSLCGPFKWKLSIIKSVENTSFSNRMRVFVDTNVLLDMICQREGFKEDADTIFRYCIEDIIKSVENTSFSPSFARISSRVNIVSNHLLKAFPSNFKEKCADRMGK